jgi:hypothetical protein
MQKVKCHQKTTIENNPQASLEFRILDDRAQYRVIWIGKVS